MTIIWLALLNDLIVDEDENQRDLLHRCSDKYGYDVVVRSGTFRLQKWAIGLDPDLPELELIVPPPHIQERMDRDTRPRDENGDLIPKPGTRLPFGWDDDEPQLLWKSAEARHLDGCSCRGCDHCECPCHK